MLVAPSRTSYLPHGLVGASSVNQASKHYNTQPQAPGRATRSSVCARPRRRGGRLSLCGGRQTAAGGRAVCQVATDEHLKLPKSGLPYLAVPHFPPRDGYRQRALHRQAGHGSARGTRPTGLHRELPGEFRFAAVAAGGAAAGTTSRLGRPMGVSPPVRALDIQITAPGALPCPALPFVSAAQLQQCIAPNVTRLGTSPPPPPAGLGLALDSLEGWGRAQAKSVILSSLVAAKDLLNPCLALPLQFSSESWSAIPPHLACPCRLPSTVGALSMSIVSSYCSSCLPSPDASFCPPVLVRLDEEQPRTNSRAAARPAAVVSELRAGCDSPDVHAGLFTARRRCRVETDGTSGEQTLEIIACSCEPCAANQRARAIALLRRVERFKGLSVSVNLSRPSVLALPSGVAFCPCVVAPTPCMALAIWALALWPVRPSGQDWPDTGLTRWRQVEFFAAHTRHYADVLNLDVGAGESIIRLRIACSAWGLSLPDDI
ncbi:hypothetical protein Purlil1_9916 [Purpureocillium lilacinum]|uniref:Uncharacterized protein n=1 Tax=Purpureocillium lilacinum TaxID=33203 RepID=A0ABR0BP92_PURLI|nr:hypothetical protein Purlil1_9916 [Purpureocillium lilacinum]